MQTQWPILIKPPVIIAIFQLRFTHNDYGDLSKMIANDSNIRKAFPKRQDNYHSNIGVQGTPVPGISTFKAKADTKISSYIYLSANQLKKLVIEENSITYLSEEPYKGWEFFKIDAISCLELLKVQLSDCLINRTSLRFINKFSFPTFDNPLEYFSKTITTDNISTNVFTKYAFRLDMQVHKKEINAIVNHALEPTNFNAFEYYLDIDVLGHKQYNFDVDLLSNTLEEIRIVKNEIFFDTIKPKTIDLCN